MPLIKVSGGTPLMKPGTYPATLIGIKPKSLVTKFTVDPTKPDDFLEWTWLVEGPDKDVEINSLTSLATGPKSRMYEYLTALGGGEPPKIDAEFDESDLVGKGVLVTTVLDEEGWSKIDSIVAAPVARAATAAPTKPAPATRRAAAAAVAEVEAEEAVEKAAEAAVEEVAEDDLPF